MLLYKFAHSSTKLYIYYYIDIYLKMLFWRYHRERENSENEMPVKNTCYTGEHKYHLGGKRDWNDELFFFFFFFYV